MSIYELLLVGATVAPVFITPFTKVEESFTLHAVHDILTHGTSPAGLSLYDHQTFPGALPRSFIPSLILSAFAYPLAFLNSRFPFLTSLLSIQLLIRTTLALLTSFSLLFLARRAKSAFNKPIANLFLVFTFTQFHVLYYASRTLPNMLAFPFVQIALGLLIHPSTQRTTFTRKDPDTDRVEKKDGSLVSVLYAFGILTFVATVMRFEVVGFIIPLGLDALARKTVTFWGLAQLGVAVGVVSLGASILVDSYFWGTNVWPEGYSVLFNVVQGHSASWGVSPFYHYFLNLPRLLPTLPLALFACLIDRRARRLVYPSFGFILLLSCLKHKEWRFFVYAFPAFNVAAAAGGYGLGILYGKTLKRMALLSIVTLNVLLLALSLTASYHNYPGGAALSYLETIESSSTPLKIHLDAQTCMTGASLFTLSNTSPQPWYLPSSPSSPPSWSYSKSEDLVFPAEFAPFDYVVTGDPSARGYSGFEVVKSFGGFGGFKLVGGKRVDGEWPLKVLKREAVWVMKRK
ncbi:alpha-1,6-mannosyltransferase, glycosyltransferase family 22 protein [Pseudohyphozyma bogoriensis]|nr:alpha-1,6-mannosyltransferase, glycosyltransferase family 22 protein [Pseudohyphozyma bogoriensis]